MVEGRERVCYGWNEEEVTRIPFDFSAHLTPLIEFIMRCQNVIG